MSDASERKKKRDRLENRILLLFSRCFLLLAISVDASNFLD
jgi:hypothetical protein